MRKWIIAALAAVLSCGQALAQQDSATPVTGFDPGPVAVTATPANASHAAGTAVGCAAVTCAGNQGALFLVPVARFAGYSLILTQIAVTSSGGYASPYLVRVWAANPVNTTCKDNTAFVGNFTTDDAFLVTPPFSLTMAAPAQTTGDAGTYGASTGITWDARNLDATGTKFLYVCLVATATDTADENKAIRVMMSGPQN